MKKEKTHLADSMELMHALLSNTLFKLFSQSFQDFFS